MTDQLNSSATDRQTSPSTMLDALTHALDVDSQLEFAVLIGSRAAETAQPHSDWDIALQWNAALDWLDVLAKTETLRRKLAAAMGIVAADIDLIELRRANLTMRANVAENGLPLTGENSLAWAHFLTRTWRDLEDFYWEQRRAA